MLDQLLVVVSVTTLVMVTPGPDMVLVLRNTLIAGRRAGLQTSMGILGGNLVHITYCLVGVGLLISRSILAFSALKYVAPRTLSILESRLSDPAHKASPRKQYQPSYLHGRVAPGNFTPRLSQNRA
jgi:threonine/homoserine/homoserine lactone efflux protein